MLAIRQYLTFPAVLRRLRREQDGVTAVEFALVAPPLLLLILATIEVSIVMFVQQTMESSLFAASRLGKTGYVESGQSREETILQMLYDRGGNLFVAENIEIDTLAYDQFSQIGEPEPFVDANSNGVRDSGENYTDINGNGQYDADMGSIGVGDAGQVVVYTARYPWRIQTPLLQALMDGGDGNMVLSARAVVKNEPY